MTATNETKSIIGILGGSGVYHMDNCEPIAEHRIETPFGETSDLLCEAKVGDRTIFFMARHGRGHQFSPSEINVRANIYALKSVGVTHLVAISAVGIMREDISPGDMVTPDQIFDRTKGVRPSTFFSDGIVGHVTFADPICSELRGHLTQAASAVTRCHSGGTYLCMEGPQFSTRAESNFYREAVNATVIGMTALPEAKLAREAEMCYAMLALATDYDCWHHSQEDVTVEAVLAVLKANAENANRIVQQLVATLPETTTCDCLKAAEHAIVTSPEMIADSVKERLSLLYGKYF